MPRATPDVLGNECFRNGKTFLALAGLAEAREEFGHAYSLTILAWEELAKCLVYRMVQTGIMSFETDSSKTRAIVLVDRHIMNRHREKHLVVACSLLGMQVIDSIGDPPRSRERTDRELGPEELARITPEQVAAVMPVGVRPEDLLGLQDRVRADPELLRNIREMSGAAESWNRARNRGFYVDDSDSGIGSPWDVTRDELQRVRSLLDQWYVFNEHLLEGFPPGVLELIQRTLLPLYESARVPRKFVRCEHCVRDLARKASKPESSR